MIFIVVAETTGWRGPGRNAGEVLAVLFGLSLSAAWLAGQVALVRAWWVAAHGGGGRPASRRAVPVRRAERPRPARTVGGRGARGGGGLMEDFFYAVTVLTGLATAGVWLACLVTANAAAPGDAPAGAGWAGAAGGFGIGGALCFTFGLLGESFGLILLCVPALLLAQWLTVRALIVTWRSHEAAEDAADPFAADDAARAGPGPAAVNPLDAPPRPGDIDSGGAV